MTSNLNPTTQFHPYQPPDAVPVAEREPTSLDRALRGVGLERARLASAAERGRVWARKHPGKLLGGMAAGVIALGLLRSRLPRARGVETTG